MSPPKKASDPVEVGALAPKEVQRSRDAALAAIAAARDLDELKAARIAHTGDRAPLTLANAEIGALPSASRASAGKRIGAARSAIRTALTRRQAELEAERDQRVLVDEAVDVTLPWDRSLPGARHPVTTVGERLVDVFVALGYEVAEGPEVEAEWYNFDALNFPPDHPAREMYDTIFVAGDDGAQPSGVAQGSGVLLRTHTSPVQIRSLLTRPLPLYVVSPGKCYRTDTLDATHSPVFHQIECLAVDEGLTMADLRGAINAFVEAMFGEGLQTRLRPDFFPFTEPSADVSMECHVCRGASTRAGGAPCRVCRSQGWIEIAGCGMVNPRVLIACGIDPDRYSGFAFGLGIDRSVMIRHGVTDIRDTLEGDVRFSRAFGMEA
ncbi:MAG: phenylalanine--tRNA ligase subunit alpha [Actinobacteria bacterium]|nr:phenylalanine--tRNA ligase subunit alpha [Actinomycetota bacterium]MBO0837673.1 phenylalanine--tRNA ligase subunit alpha [Actinomycetota bacterium]